MASCFGFSRHLLHSAGTKNWKMSAVCARLIRARGYARIRAMMKKPEENKAEEKKPKTDKTLWQKGDLEVTWKDGRAPTEEELRKLRPK